MIYAEEAQGVGGAVREVVRAYAHRHTCFGNCVVVPSAKEHDNRLMGGNLCSDEYLAHTSPVVLIDDRHPWYPRTGAFKKSVTPNINLSEEEE